MSSLYVFALILTPEGTKTKGVRPSAEIPAQTMTELGFCTLFTNLYSSGIEDTVRDKIISFCLFKRVDFRR